MVRKKRSPFCKRQPHMFSLSLCFLLGRETYTDEDLISMVTDGLDPAEAVKVQWMGLETEESVEDSDGSAGTRATKATASSAARSDTVMHVVLALLVIAVVGLAVAYYNARKRIKTMKVPLSCLAARWSSSVVNLAEEGSGAKAYRRPGQGQAKETINRAQNLTLPV
jgi:hypothetical protein